MKRLKSRSVCQCKCSAKRVGCKVSAATAGPCYNIRMEQAPGTSHDWSTQGCSVCYSPRPAATLESSSFFRNTPQ